MDLKVQYNGCPHKKGEICSETDTHRGGEDIGGSGHLKQGMPEATRSWRGLEEISPVASEGTQPCQ